MVDVHQATVVVASCQVRPTDPKLVGQQPIRGDYPSRLCSALDPTPGAVQCALLLCISCQEARTKGQPVNGRGHHREQSKPRTQVGEPATSTVTGNSQIERRERQGRVQRCTPTQDSAPEADRRIREGERRSQSDGQSRKHRPYRPQRRGVRPRRPRKRKDRYAAGRGKIVTPPPRLVRPRRHGLPRPRRGSNWGVGSRGGFHLIELTNTFLLTGIGIEDPDLKVAGLGSEIDTAIELSRTEESLESG